MAPNRPATPRSVARAAIGAVVLAVSMAPTSDALAWVEQHVARDDVRLEVEPSGRARIEHRILLLVSGGPLETTTIRAVDPDAEVETGAYVLPEKDAIAGTIAGALPVTAKRIADDGSPLRADLQLTFDEGKGLTRGRWVVFVRYGTDLAGRGQAVREGATTLLSWTGPVWEDGLDTTRAVFALPFGPTEPRAVDGPSSDPSAEGADHASALSQLTRRPGTDTLEIVRPYAARGERVTWRVRADARAVPLAGAQADSVVPSSAAPMPSRVAAPIVVGSLLGSSARAFGLGFAAFALVAGLIAAHAREIGRTLAAVEQKARPLLPMPLLLRALLGAASFSGGAALQLGTAHATAGSLLVASSALFALHRPALRRPTLRPPGSWLPVRTDEVFGSEAAPVRGWFELGGPRGRALFASLAVVFAALAIAAARSSRIDAALVALDFAPILALFFPSPSRLAVPDLRFAPVPFLSDVARRIEQSASAVRIIPRLRLPQGQADADELRLVLLPQPARRGLRAIEIAVAVASGPTGHLLVPEILVRMDEGSACESACSTLASHGRVGRGRRADERVIAIAPKLPDARTTAELALAIVETIRSEIGPTEARTPAGSSPARRPLVKSGRAAPAAKRDDAALAPRSAKSA
jgi:hypothetical protein